MLSGPIVKFFIRGCTPKGDALLANGTAKLPDVNSGGRKLSGPHRHRAETAKPDEFADGT